MRFDADIPASVRQLMDSEACGCDPRVSLFDWNGQLFYVHHFVGPACNTIPSYYDQDGNKLELDREEQNRF